MDARSALFDVYGDHLRVRGGAAPVAALVRLAAALDIAAPAVRTAISRMVRQDWLVPARVGTAPGYALTARALRRLDAAALRIYRGEDLAWDGTWHLVVMQPVTSRAARARIRAGLGFLGYGPLDATVWISPRASEEVVPLLDAENARAATFSAHADGEPAELVRRAWDLADLGASYGRWLDEAAALVEPAPADDEAAFAARSRLVHEWRKFLFRDPGLPRALLPTPWPGVEAAAFFNHHAARLQPAAARFVAAVLSEGG